MALPSEIVSRGEAMAYLQAHTGFTEDNIGVLEMLKPMVENLVRRFCGHEITQGTYTEFYPRHDKFPVTETDIVEITGSKVSFVTSHPAGDVLYLKNLFVSSVTTVHEDTSAYAGQGASDFAAATLLTAGTNYWVDLDESGLSRNGALRRINRSWPARKGTVQVVYVAGFTATQLDTTYNDMKIVVLDELSIRYNIARSRSGGNQAGLGMVKSESIAQEYKVEYETESLKVLSHQPLAPSNQDKLQAGGYVKLTV